MKISSSSQVKEILESLGYKVKDFGNYFTSNAAYRGGEDEKSLVIYKDSWKFIDFPENKVGSIYDLIKLSGAEDLQIQDFDLIKLKEKETIDETFDNSLIDNLLPDYSYFKGRGISENAQKLFEAGFCHGGKLNRRVVFPIRDFSMKICGFAGRTTRKDLDNIAKWKILGRKNKFVYPWQLSCYDIKEEESCILVESVGDLLALYQNGIKNVLCIFGLFCSNAVINYLCALNINNIIISVNNDKESQRGNDASMKIKKKLEEFFDNVVIYLPPNHKDWMEYTENNEEIKINV